MNENQKNILETYIDNRADFAKSEINNVPLIIAKDDINVKSFEELLDNPKKIKSEKSFKDLRGFIDYVNDFSLDSTAAFVGASGVDVIFDYHEKEQAHWCKHTAEFNLKTNSRWLEWSRNNDVWIEQRRFADMLDSGLEEILEPNQSEIIDLIKNFRATSNQEVIASDQPGGTSFRYSKDVKGSHKTTDVVLPGEIKICIRPFDGIDVLNADLDDDKKLSYYNLRATLAFRVREGSEGEIMSVEFKYKLLGLDKAHDETLETLKTALKEKLNTKKIYVC